MNWIRWRFGIARALLLLGALSLGTGLALAHEEVTVGKYLLEVGWLDEPPLVGLKNGVFVSVTDTETAEPVEELDTLEVEVATGPASKKLSLRPLGEDAPGQYAADFIPTVRGAYTARLTGSIGDQAVDVTVEIEEVGDVNDLTFPEPIVAGDELAAQAGSAAQTANAARTIAWIGLAAGVLGILLGGAAVLRKK